MGGCGLHVDLPLLIVSQHVSCPKAKPELEVEAVPSEPSIRSAEAGLLCWWRAVVTPAGYPSQHTAQISIQAHPSSQP